MLNKKIHQWDILAVSCIDGRFVKKVIEWVAKRTDDVFDFRTEVGLTKAIIDSAPDRKRFFEVINISKKLHNIKEIWLFDHIDCGAYGGSKSFDSDSEEERFHKQRLKKAKSILKKKFSNLKIKMFYIKWDEIEEV